MTSPDSGDGPVLIGYDGSDHARAAAAQAGRLFGSRPAVVATAYLSFGDSAPGALLAVAGSGVKDAVADLDASGLEEAERLAAEGAGLARDAGLDAEPRTVHFRGPFFAALVGLADELDAAAIVVGSRGRSTLAAALHGSVSTGVLHHSRRPVLVVHGPAD